MDLMSLAARLTLDSSEYEKGLSDAEDNAKKRGSGIGRALGTLGKVTAAGVAAGVTAAGAAVVKLTKDAVGAYAEYQQLVGGVETLFGTGGQNLREYAASVGKTMYEAKGDYDKLKDAQDVVIHNAEQAFRTSGLSINDYMEQVTSFSASLIQSLGGDTLEAAKVADRAIIDMSDNANKMGTDMSMIQNAYNGFAKQNYTMLDNLKLGYGGTKEEMERLIKDASKMTDVQSELGVTVDESSMSFGNIVNAISVMQKSMGIAGTTSKEAASTVSGSMGQMRAAWKNVVTNFANGGTQLKNSIGDLFETAKAMAGNMVPTIEKALEGIGEFLKLAIPEILTTVPPMVEQMLPQFANSVGKLITGAGKAVRIGIKGLFKIVRNMFKSFAGQEEGEGGFGGIAGSITKLGERIFTAIQKIFRTMFKQISKLITEVDWLAVGNRIVEMIGNGFHATMNIFVDAFRGLTSLIKSIDWLSVGSTILGWIKQGLSGIAEWFTTVFEEAKTAIAGVKWKEVGSTILGLITDALGEVVSFFTELFNNASAAIESIEWKQVGLYIWFWISDAFKGLVDWFTGLFSQSKDGVENDVDWSGLGEAILNFITSAFNAIGDVFKVIFRKAKWAILGIEWKEVGTTIWNAIVGVFTFVGTTLQALFQSAWDLISDIKWGELGTNIWNWITGLLADFGGWLYDIFSGATALVAEIDWGEVGQKVWDGIVKLVSDFGKWLKDKFTGAKSAVGEVKWDEVGKAIWDGIIGLVKGFGVWLKAVFDFTLGFVKNIKWSDIGDALWSGVTALISTIATTLKGWLDEGLRLATEEIDWSKIGDAIYNGIASAKDKIDAFLAGLLSNIPIVGEALAPNEKSNFWQDAGKAGYKLPGFKKAYDMARMFTTPTVLATPTGFKQFGDGVGGEIVMSDRKLEKIAGGRETAMAIGMLTDAVNDLSDSLTEKMVIALQQMGFSIDGREFARLVRDVRTA